MRSGNYCNFWSLLYIANVYVGSSNPIAYERSINHGQPFNKKKKKKSKWDLISREVCFSPSELE